jgi:hypothetical protein
MENIQTIRKTGARDEPRHGGAADSVTTRRIILLDEVRARLTCDTDEIVIWDLSRRGSNPILPEKIGQLALFRNQTEEGLHVWVVANVWLTIRGRGLMWQLLTILRPRYPFLVSDFSGETSEDAIKMWVALGAEKLPTASCRKKGYIYLLP